LKYTRALQFCGRPQQLLTNGCQFGSAATSTRRRDNWLAQCPVDFTNQEPGVTIGQSVSKSPNRLFGSNRFEQRDHAGADVLAVGKIETNEKMVTSHGYLGKATVTCGEQVY
jgi:hypothetical protein